MHITQLGIYNRALLHVKQQQLATLTDNIESRRVLDAWYTQGINWMLEQGFWKFALRSVEIARDEAVAPTFGYQFPHSKPVDWVRTYAVSSSEQIEDYPLESFIEESNLWFADSTPIFVRYVSNDSEYGNNLHRWTARFVGAFEYYLAEKIAPKLTGSEAMREALEGKFANELSLAKSFEAMREPPRRPQEGLWNRARFGGNQPRRMPGGWQF